jgi:hypothetical protein
MKESVNIDGQQSSQYQQNQQLHTITTSFQYTLTWKIEKR